jgi:cytochrome c55X
MNLFQRALGLAGLVVTAALALLAAAGLAWHFSAPAQAEAGPAPERQAQLAHLLTQDCGSCHGLTLAGGLGPALTPQALDGKPAEYLALVILHGRAGTAMPPWRPFLTPAEADWIARRLKEPRP